MSMSAGGGYLLSGLRVIDCPFDPSLVTKDESGRRTKKRKAKPQPAADAAPQVSENNDQAPSLSTS